MVVFAALRRDGEASRARMLAVVSANPGLHMSELASRCGLAWHTVAYHLKLLERTRLVEVEKGGRERRVYPAGVAPVHRAWLATLRQGSAAEVLRELVARPPVSIAALSRRMGRSEKVVRRHVEALARVGVLERRGQVRPVYELTPGAEHDLDRWLRAPDGARDARRPMLDDGPEEGLGP